MTTDHDTDALPDSILGALDEIKDPDKTQTDQMVTLIVQVLRRHYKKALPRPVAKLLYEAIIEFAINETRKEGSFKLPSGWGKFQLKILGQNAKPRRLPQGGFVTRQPKPVIRYMSGAIVRKMLDTQTPSEYRRQSPRTTAADRAELSDPDVPPV